jgi:hypothetical protein
LPAPTIAAVSARRRRPPVARGSGRARRGTAPSSPSPTTMIVAGFGVASPSATETQVVPGRQRRRHRDHEPREQLAAGDQRHQGHEPRR